MVTTRRRKKSETKVEEGKAVTKKTPTKTRRQKLNEELKSKATGVGLKISVDSASKKNKIVFNDEKIPIEDEVQPDPVVQQEASPNEDEDDDDVVEEVHGQVAREEILEQMDAEEKFSVRSKKKRKKKERTPMEEEEEEEFDDDFFAELEAAKEAERRKMESKKPKGKHTAFVFSQEDGLADERPRAVDQTIQVVVLQDSANDTTGNAITSVPTNALSHEALEYSRGGLANGSDGVARSATGKKRKWQPDNTWKRSKKMNSFVRVNRRGGRMAPFNFAKKI